MRSAGGVHASSTVGDDPDLGRTDGSAGRQREGRPAAVKPAGPAFWIVLGPAMVVGSSLTGFLFFLFGGMLEVLVDAWSNPVGAGFFVLGTLTTGFVAFTQANEGRWRDAVRSGLWGHSLTYMLAALPLLQGEFLDLSAFFFLAPVFGAPGIAAATAMPILFVRAHAHASLDALRPVEARDPLPLWAAWPLVASAALLGLWLPGSILQIWDEFGLSAWLWASVATLWASLVGAKILERRGMATALLSAMGAQVLSLLAGGWIAGVSRMGDDGSGRLSFEGAWQFAGVTATWMAGSVLAGAVALLILDGWGRRRGRALT